MSRPLPRVIVPGVYDLTATPAEPSVAIPLPFAMRRRAAEPDFQRAVEVAPGVSVALMGTGDLTRPAVTRRVKVVPGARIAVWADPLERPLPASQAAVALGVELPTMDAWIRNGWVPHWTTPGGHRRFDPQVLRAIKDGVPLAGLEVIAAALLRQAARAS